MGWQEAHDAFFEADGPYGLEWVLVRDLGPKSWAHVRFLLIASIHGSTPANADFLENREVWNCRIIQGFGTFHSDETEPKWIVFESEDAMHEYQEDEDSRYSDEEE